MHSNLYSGQYRVSAKALILDETRTKFLISLETNGWWELPGGGLAWDETPQQGITREVKEEMGMDVTYVATTPAYFMKGQNAKGTWSANIVFETKVKDLNFTPSDECTEIRFVTKEEVLAMENVFRNVREMAEMFDPKNHAVI